MQQIPSGETPLSSSSVNSKRRFRFDAYQMIDSIVGLKPWINRDILFPQLIATRPQSRVLHQTRQAQREGFIDLENDLAIHKALGMEEMRNLMSQLTVFKFIHDTIRESVLQEGGKVAKLVFPSSEQTPSHHPATPVSYTPKGQYKLGQNSRGAQVQRALNFIATQEERSQNQDIESVYSEAQNVRGSGMKMIFKIERKSQESRNKAQKQQSRLEDYFKADQHGIQRTLKILKGE